MKKILSAILILMLTVSNITPAVFAENELKPEATASATVQNSNRKKTKETPAPSPSPKALKQDEKVEEKKEEKAEKTTDIKTEEKSDNSPEVVSEAAFLIESGTKKVIYEKNADKRMYPASTTKIMTAYLVLKHLDLNTELTASKEAVSIPLDSSKMALSEGETLTVSNLLKALLIQSANDAANVLAEGVSGSIKEFVVLMNKTAKKLGMNNTNFVNPHGYHDDKHYTTARDMAIITEKALENDIFAEIVSLQRIEIPPTNKFEETRLYATRNMLISRGAPIEYKYSYATGVKTGRTSKAGSCLVASAERNGMELISVCFKAPAESMYRVYTDTRNLFLYANETYRLKTVLKGDELASVCKVKWSFGRSDLILKSNKDIKALLPKATYNEELITSEIHINEDITAPVKEGDVLGTAKYFYDGELVAESNLYSTRNIKRNYIKQFFSYILSLWFLTAFGLIVALIIVKRVKQIQRAKRLRRAKMNSIRRR